jgi:ribosomal protein S12 methylthiotransferase accessory factor
MIELCCRSSGMCAGNTNEEALVQGICEILERHVKATIFNHHIGSPTIPFREIKNETSSVALIQELNENGYQVILKDLSLGGQYPVIGTILLHGGMRRYMFNTGADPWRSVAINRSLTEMFQRSENWIKSSTQVMFSPRSDQKITKAQVEHQKERLISQLISGAGQQTCPDQFLWSSGEVKIFEACNDPANNRSALRDLIMKIQRNGYQIFVRDESYLGFPSLRVYIPGMSELMMFADGLFDLYLNKTKVQDAVLQLSNCSDDQYSMLLQALERAYDETMFQYPADMISFLSSLCLQPDSDFNQFRNPEVLLMLLNARTGNHAGAYKYLSQLFEQELLSDLDNQGSYYFGTLIYFKMRSEDRSLKEIESNLSNLIGEDVAKEVLADQQDPKSTFQYMKLPKCGDCGPCPVEEECHYPQWKTISAKLGKIRQANPIQQTDLADLFCSLTQ